MAEMTIFHRMPFVFVFFSWVDSGFNVIQHQGLPGSFFLNEGGGRGAFVSCSVVPRSWRKRQRERAKKKRKIRKKGENGGSCSSFFWRLAHVGLGGKKGAILFGFSMAAVCVHVSPYGCSFFSLSLSLSFFSDFLLLFWTPRRGRPSWCVRPPPISIWFRLRCFFVCLFVCFFVRPTALVSRRPLADL